MNLKIITISFLVAILFINCNTERKNSVSNNEGSALTNFIKKGKNNKLNPKERLSYLDSAKILLKSYPGNTDSLGMDIMHNKGLIYLHKKQSDSFYFYNKTLVEKAKIATNSHFLGKSQFNLGYYYDDVVYKPDSAFFYYQQAKNTYFKVRNTTEAIDILINIALLQKNQNDFYGAKETLTEAIGNLNKDSESLVSIYNEMATNNRKLLNYLDAEKYYRLAISNTNVKKKIIRYKNNLATLYIETKNYDKAIFIFEKLLTDITLNKESTTYARIWDNYTYAKWKSGNHSLKFNFIKSLNIRKEKNDRRGQIASYTHLGEYFYQTSPNCSKKYLDTVIQISRQLKIPKAETDALQFLMDLEPRNITYRDRYIFLKDSMYTNELRVKTQFAKMKYDDELEKAQILELETEAAQKRAEIAEQKTQKVIFLSLSGFLLLGGISLYFVLRQRHKKEKLQEVYNTEKRISQDLHDGLANDVFGLMTNLQVKNKEAGDLVDSLEGIYQITRQISHENAAIRTGVYFKDELNALISNYQNGGTTLLIKGISAIDWPQLNEHKCVIVHRSIKELLVNMKKHAQASLVSLQFENQKNNLIILYTDNGVGFDPKKSNGIGLMNTGNRIRSVGGELTFEKKQGTGAKVIISIPL